MKVHKNIWVDKEVWDALQKKKYNCSLIFSQTAETILGISDSKTEILKKIDEKEQEVTTLKVKLQQIKVKQGMSIEEYLQLINENDAYTPEKKEEIKYYLLRSVELIQDDPTYAIGRALLITKKFGLEITHKMLTRFANMTGLEQKDCTCEIPSQYRNDLVGQRCGKCFGIIQKHRHVSQSERKTTEILKEMKAEFANKKTAVEVEDK